MRKLEQATVRDVYYYLECRYTLRSVTHALSSMERDGTVTSGHVVVRDARHRLVDVKVYQVNHAQEGKARGAEADEAAAR